MSITVNGQKKTALALLFNGVRHEKLLTIMEASEIAFSFDNNGQLVEFLKSHHGDAAFAGGAQKFSNPLFKKSFAKVTKTVCTFDRIQNRELSAVISVTTTEGAVEIGCFTSLKRHALISFRSDYRHGRDAKAANSIVRDDGILEACFKTYVERVARQIKDRGYIFNYSPKQNDTWEVNGQIVFETDTNFLGMEPRVGDGRMSIHCYPTRGTEVRSLNQVEYAALVSFLLWYYRTDENTALNEKVNYLKRMEYKHGATNSTYQQKVRKIEKLSKDVEADLKKLRGFGLNLKKRPFTQTDYEALTKSKTLKNEGQLKTPVNKAVEKLYELLYTHGIIPQVVLKARVRQVNAKKTNSPKCPDLNNDSKIVFKTHKAEVQSNIQNLRFDVVAWLLQGVADHNEGEWRVILTPKPNKQGDYETRATTNPEFEGRAHAHLTTREQFIKELTDAQSSVKNVQSNLLKIQKLFELLDHALAEKDIQAFDKLRALTV